jgi:flagellar hook-length control protein FliK
MLSPDLLSILMRGIQARHLDWGASSEAPPAGDAAFGRLFQDGVEAPPRSASGMVEIAQPGSEPADLAPVAAAEGHALRAEAAGVPSETVAPGPEQGNAAEAEGDPSQPGNLPLELVPAAAPPAAAIPPVSASTGEDATAAGRAASPHDGSDPGKLAGTVVAPSREEAAATGSLSDEPGTEAGEAPNMSGAAPGQALSFNPEDRDVRRDPDARSTESGPGERPLAARPVEARPARPAPEGQTMAAEPEAEPGPAEDRASLPEEPRATPAPADRAASAAAGSPTGTASGLHAAPVPAGGAEFALAPGEAEFGWRLSADPVTGAPSSARELAIVSAAAMSSPPSAVTGQVALAIRSSDSDRVEIRLDPPELGRVQIEMRVVEGSLHAVVVAERAEIGDLLRRHAEMLQRDLQAAGYGDVSLDFAAGHQDRSERRNTGGEVVGQLDLIAAAPPAVQTARPALEGRLDIRL